MRPAIVKEASNSNPNLPHVGGRYAKFADYIEDFISGFSDYAKFLYRLNREKATMEKCSTVLSAFRFAR